MPTTIDEDGLNGSPWYVRAVVRVGVPTAFASLLLWFLLSNVTGVLNSLLARQGTAEQNTVLVLQNQSTIISLLAAHEGATMQMTRYLQALCLNVSTTEGQRQRCLDASR